MQQFSLVLAVLMIMILFGLETIGGARPYESYYELTNSYCSSWRVGVEANNVWGWRTVPTQCLFYVQYYMLGGQYESDLEMIMHQINTYVDDILNVSSTNSSSPNNAWVLDIDDTCISNLLYYTGKRFGCDPYDPGAFKAWANAGACPAIPTVLRLFRKLVHSGFKVFIISGRDEETLGESTFQNLHNQGFIGYQRLILRPPEHRGKSAVLFKSMMRRQLVEEGYRIRGNVGDQWSDLAGDCLGERTFKLPNPMYFVP